jgi:aryl-phospho-beta-D-glucosidase BglC (GH1 family)
MKKLSAILFLIFTLSIMSGCATEAPRIDLNIETTTSVLSTTSSYTETEYDDETTIYTENESGDIEITYTATVSEDEEETEEEIILSETEAATTTTEVKPQTTTATTTTAKPAATTAATTTMAQTAAVDLKLTFSNTNSWEEGGKTVTQFDGVIKNNGSNTVSGWTVKLKMGKNAEIINSWSADFTLSGGVLTATPVDYNTDITPSGEVSFGVIIKDPGEIDKNGSSVTAGAVVNNQNSNNGNNDNNNSGGTPPTPVSAKDVPPPTTDDWLYVDGTKITDKSGKEVWLTGVNWFGYNTGTNTFDGLWAADLNGSIASIADHGFNLLRIPFSVELIKNWSQGSYPNANFNQATNSYLVGMNSLQIFDYVVGQCRANGIKIMIDIHSAATDSMGHMDADWIAGGLTEKDFTNALAWMADRYKNDDTIIAYDLKNEPHGKPNENPRIKWDGSSDADNWRYVAEKAAKAVLNKNANVLVMVEGIEIYPIDTKTNGDFSSTNSGDYYFSWWGGNLRGVVDHPVDLGRFQNKLVYSPHDYGPAVYAQPWFSGNYTYQSLMTDYWRDSWFYIHEDGIAPLLIGEWGGFMTEPNLKWMTLMRRLIKENRLHHTFWCFNANSGDTGGLVKDDFTTWDTEKYNFVKEVLWQQGGKFVGLDHKIPLGENGITLSEAQ